MDITLVKAIVELRVPFFGKSLKNKGDSRSCLFDPRKLLSSPEILEHVGKRIAKIAKNKCSGKTLIGMSTSGIAWAAVASLYSGMPMLYVRKKLETQISSKFIEGILPKNKKLILIDDLIFAGESKKGTIEIISKHGFQVSEIIVIIDRQLQRKKDGLPLQKQWNLKLYSLITMSEIIRYMKQRNAISQTQLNELIKDYRRFDRWDMPDFAK